MFHFYAAPPPPIHLTPRPISYKPQKNQYPPVIRKLLSIITTMARKIVPSLVLCKAVISAVARSAIAMNLLAGISILLPSFQCHGRGGVHLISHFLSPTNDRWRQGCQRKRRLGISSLISM